MIEAIALVVTGGVAAAVLVLTHYHVVSKSRISEAYQYAVYAAYAAEEMFQGGDGQVKLHFAVDRVLARFNISEDDARMLVNAAVKGLRLTGVKVPPDPGPASAKPAPSTLRSIS